MNLRALLELCRISNLPTVWSNCAVGLFGGITTFELAFSEKMGRSFETKLTASNLIDSLADAPFDWARLLLHILIPFSLLYVGGMILNDYLDRRIDAEERPNRPIPSGRVQPSTAKWLAIVCFLVGIIGVWWFEQRAVKLDDQPWRATAFGGLLIVTIIMYNLTHQRTARSVLLMGACRALIVLSIAAAFQAPVIRGWWFLFVAGPAATLLIYTVLISIVARNEMQPRWFGGPKTVMNMIAGMPLLDAVWLAVMGLWPASLFCVACSVLTKLGHRKVAGS